MFILNPLPCEQDRAPSAQGRALHRERQRESGWMAHIMFSNLVRQVANREYNAPHHVTRREKRQEVIEEGFARDGSERFRYVGYRRRQTDTFAPR